MLMRWLCFSYLFVAALSSALTGCGGGKGDGGTNPTSGDGFTVSTTALSFSATQNGSLPQAQDIQTSFTNPEANYVGASYPPGVSPASWLKITSTGSGNVFAFHISVNTTNLAPTTYSTTIILGISRQDGSLIAYRNINVSYTVQPQTGYKVTPQSLSFTQLQNGSGPASQTLTLSDISGSSYAWSASIIYQSGSDWLTINNAVSVSGGSLPMSLSVGINQKSDVGTNTAIIRVTGNGNSIDIPVVYSVFEPQLKAVPASLVFSALGNDPTNPAAQSVTLTTESNQSLNYSAAVNYGAGASGWLTVPVSGSAPGAMAVEVNTTNLKVGTYTATLVVQTATQSLSIPVSYVVRAVQLTPTPTQLTFNALQGGSVPSAQSVSFGTESNINVTYTTSVSYGMGASGWLTVPVSGSAPGVVSISVNTTGLGAGNYTATVSIVPGNGGAVVTIGVVYQVQIANLTLTPGQLSFSIGNSSIAADLSGSIAVGDTGAVLSWSAVSSQPWLVVDTASGATTGDGKKTAMSASLVQSELEKLKPGSYVGKITFTYTRPDASISTAYLAVSLNLSLPVVNFVAPYVATADVADSVIIRGQGFIGVTAKDLKFGTTAATSVTVVSDTELRASFGAMSVGNYPVTITNQLGVNRSRAKLVVVTTQTFGATAFASAGAKTRVIYDGERRALYVVNSGAVTIERYVYDAGTGNWVASSRSYPQLNDAALSPDGSQLVAVSNTTVRVLDPDSLNETGQTAFTDNWGGFYYLRQIAFANNGKAVVTTGLYGSGYTNIYLYDMLSPSLKTISSAYFSPLAASADGSRVVLGDNGLSPAQLVRFYSASSDTVVSSAVARNLSGVALDRTASRSVLNWYEVFDSGFNLLGNLQGFSLAAALSPEGTIAYSYDYNLGKIRKFDLTGALVAGSFPEVGSGVTLTTSPGTGSVMTISPDGKTLFIAGNQNVLIVPVP